MPSFPVYTLAERPDLEAQVLDLSFEVWDAFMLEDAVANRLWMRLFTDFPEYQTTMCDAEGQVIASGNTIPLVWDGTVEGLPKGWDGVLENGFRDHDSGLQPDTLSALSISIAKSRQGQGLSKELLKGMKWIAASHGLGNLIAPVRPSVKSKYPLIPMERYCEWTNSNGALFDPWLRTHSRLGAEVLGVEPESMYISGTVAQWEQWAGMRFPESGSYVVPGALVPIIVDTEQDRAIYVEPNVWMRHRVTEQDLLFRAPHAG